MNEPFKKGDWVGELETTKPMLGTVRECYPDDLKPGAFLIDLVCYAPHGEKIGRKSPALDGPTGYEPCISASRFAKIEKPEFPLEMARYSKTWNVSFLK